MDEISRNRNLKVKYNEERKEINIFGNKEGLEYLSEVCRRITCGKAGEHYHFTTWAKDIQLYKDSLALVVWFAEDVENAK